MRHNQGTCVDLLVERRGPRWVALTDADAARVAELMRGDRPVEVEIGCGKALYVVTKADRNRHLEFIGIDTAERYLKHGRRRSLRRNLSNLLLVKADARELVQRGIPPKRVAAFHVNFPDPWPKRRHWDRRLLSPGFLAVLRERLIDGGSFVLATDVEEYFRQVEGTARGMRPEWRHIRTSVGARPDGDTARSGYENKCLTKGAPVYYLALTA